MLRFLCAAVILLTSCAPARIDGRSVDKANESIRVVRRSAGTARAAEFDRALQFLMSDGETEVPLLSDPAVRARISGKTADEVIASAAALRDERQKRAHEEEVQRQLADLKASIGRIESAEPKITLAPAPPPIDPFSEEAIWREEPLTDDRQIVDFCSRRFDEMRARRQCEQDELRAKQLLARGLPRGVSQYHGTRIRIHCKGKMPVTYRGRAVCEADTARTLEVIRLHPEALERLPADVRAEMEALLPQRAH
ncbi:MAG TPA: hypothetical protein VGK31_05695 [Thermoanaerobaculia bacterium]